ncbi:U-box domain-containing protein 9-like [Olea europaea var. sylvestris]|uniref:U-box domain-containing protein 9-like n=1 Tax=Olea europaea var. sylvestris TaxID=158386 RepID=UPI000C1D4F03|nr:U-box domain-containing protein 9-like [Olea europaea var. sylvestris]
MAKSAECGVVPQAKATVEMKRELERMVNAIVEEEDYTVEATDHAMGILWALKDLKLKAVMKPQELLGLDNFCFSAVPPPPPELRCPISGELMKDPVVLASGQTYDETFIQKWLKDGHQTCPTTDHVLPHTLLTPNHLVKKIISKWSKEKTSEMSSAEMEGGEEYVEDANLQQFTTLLERLSSSSLSDQKEAVKETRVLSNRSPSFRARFQDAIPQLFDTVLLERANSYIDLREDLVAIILNLSVHDSNRKLVGETPSAIHFLIETLRNERIETRSNAAAALLVLSTLDSNKHIIGKSGAIKPLIDLIEEGHPLTVKDAAAAILSLCTVVENRAWAVTLGAVTVLTKKVMDDILIDEMLDILAILCSHQKAVEELGELGAVSCLLDILRKNVSELNKEKCVAILYTMCFSDRTKLREILAVESACETLSNVAQTGTSRARRKANGILERLN